MDKLRRILGPILLLALVAGVGYGVYQSWTDKQQENAVAEQQVARGLIGSEKEPFFADPRVQAAFAAKGLAVKVEKAGSREITNRADLKDYDFAFPSGAPTGLAIKQKFPSSQVFTPFFTPMAVASWKPIAGILQANGIVEKRGNHFYIVDMHKLLAAVVAGTRWKELKDSQAYPVNKSVLVGSTDVRKSNSAAMYLALASYVFNKDQVVDKPGEADSLVPELAPLFSRQGFQESSSAGPFEDYLAMGMGKAPLVMVYEAQFIEQLAGGSPRPDAVLLYPSPTVFSKHTLVGLSPVGKRVGELLDTDPELRHLAIEYGFRNGDRAYLQQFWGQHGIDLPQDVIDVVDPPNYELMERMIDGIAERMRCGDAGC